MPLVRVSNGGTLEPSDFTYCDFYAGVSVQAGKDYFIFFVSPSSSVAISTYFESNFIGCSVVSAYKRSPIAVAILHATSSTIKFSSSGTGSVTYYGFIAEL